MNKHKIAIWPQDQYRFRIFDNGAARLRDWPEVMEVARPDCVAAINLAYFALSDIPAKSVAYFDHQSAIMVAGKWGMMPHYHEYGICIDADGRMTLGTEKDAVYDYAVGLPPAIISGADYNTTKYGTNGVTYTGLRADGTVVTLLCSKDKGMTSQEAVDSMRAGGCVHIFRWDGSWSSRGCLGPGMEVTPSQYRLVRSWLLIFRRHKPEDKPMDRITQRFMTKNRCYTNQVKCSKTRAMLHSTGTPGATAANIIAAWDKPEAGASVEFVIDDTGIYQTLPPGIRSWHSGSSANSTHVACEICEPIETRMLSANWKPLSRDGKNNTTYAVTMLQKELTGLGYDPKGIDGFFGPGCEAALKAFQRDRGLTADGYCGKATLKALQSREGSFLRYPAAEVQAYFENVYAKAVALFAWLMEELGGDPDEVLCHSEGYKAGIASNHVDVLHWFPEHGKSMDDFRADVKAAMTPRLTLDEAVDRLALAGVIAVPEYWKDGLYSTANVQALIIKMAATMK